MSGHITPQPHRHSLESIFAALITKGVFSRQRPNNPVKREDKISSIYHNPKRMPRRCNMFWIFFHMNNDDDKRCQTQSTCQITCKLRASSSTRKRQIRFIAGRFEKRSVWGSGQETCLVWMGPSAQNLFFLAIMEGAMTPSTAHKYGYSA